MVKTVIKVRWCDAPSRSAVVDLTKKCERSGSVADKDTTLFV